MIETPVEHASEFATVVNGAVEEMDALVQRGRLQNDPLRFVIIAEQIFLKAFYKVALDLVQPTAQRIAPVMPPDREWRRIAAQMAEAGATSLARMNRRWGFRDAVLVAAGLVVALSVGAYGGWRLHGDPPALQCRDQTDGSRVCYMFERPPIATKR